MSQHIWNNGLSNGWCNFQFIFMVEINRFDKGTVYLYLKHCILVLIPDGSRKFVRYCAFLYLRIYYLIIFTFFFFCRKWLTIEEIILPWMWYFYGGWWLIFVIGVLNSLEQIRASSGWKVFKSLKQVQDGFGAESELVAASDFGLQWKNTGNYQG